MADESKLMHMRDGSYLILDNIYYLNEIKYTYKTVITDFLTRVLLNLQTERYWNTVTTDHKITCSSNGMYPILVYVAKTCFTIKLKYICFVDLRMIYISCENLFHNQAKINKFKLNKILQFATLLLYES